MYFFKWKCIQIIKLFSHVLFYYFLYVTIKFKYQKFWFIGNKILFINFISLKKKWMDVFFLGGLYPFGLTRLELAALTFREGGALTNSTAIPRHIFIHIDWYLYGYTLSSDDTHYVVICLLLINWLKIESMKKKISFVYLNIFPRFYIYTSWVSLLYNWFFFYFGKIFKFYWRCEGLINWFLKYKFNCSQSNDKLISKFYNLILN